MTRGAGKCRLLWKGFAVRASKIHQTLAKDLASRGGVSPIRVIVKYREHVAKAKAIESARLPEAPSRVLSVMPAVAVAAAPAQIEALSQEPDVERIWPDLRVHSCLDVSVPLIGAPWVWSQGYTGAGVGIVILDTGIDVEHVDFAGRIAGSADFTGEGVVDLNGHGTHVAGTACGDGRAGDGAYRGVAPGADLYVAKVLDRTGAAYMSDVMAGIDWAIQQDVHVLNLSLSGPAPGDGSDALSETCDLVAERGFVVCVAAGNSGPETSSIGPPGCARQVITVGASTDEDIIMEASSRGPTSDGRTKPDVLFPGTGIVSCRAQGTELGNPLNSVYTEMSGTSMATPHASGVAALLLEADPGLTPAEIKELMMTTAVDLGLEENTQGAGRGDAAEAIAQIRVPDDVPQAPGCLAQLPALSELLRGLWQWH
jgi:subtilisin family serine protease